MWAGPSESLLTKRIWHEWWDTTTLTKDCNFSLASSLSLAGTFISSHLFALMKPDATLWVALWRDPGGKELRKASSQQLMWNRILPTTSGVSLESSSAPSWALRWDSGPRQPMACLQPMRDPEPRDQLSLAQIPNSQKLWNNKRCLKPPSLEFFFFCSDR